MSITKYSATLRRLLKDIQHGYIPRYLRNSVLKHVESDNSFNRSEIPFNKYYLEDYWLKDSENCKVDWLHNLNHVRIPAIYEAYFAPNLLNESVKLIPRKEFEKIKILDIGCGGGICSEALAELNFDVTGIDPNPDMIVVAEHHAQENRLLRGKRLRYFHTTLEDFFTNNLLKFDAIVISEVLDRISNRNKFKFLQKCINCLRVDGNVFITARGVSWHSFKSLFKYGLSYGAEFEYHHWSKGINDYVLEQYLEANGCTIRTVRGLEYEAIDRTFEYRTRTDGWYFMHAVKNKLVLN